MKKTVLTSIAIVAILMAGCSKKRPEVAVQEAPVMSDAQMLAQLASQIQNQVQNVYFDFDKYNVK
ncbi:MAG: peptidoglycan-associated lipoprotein, partial [Campylobacter ureolyticus]|nr:peptidoglycan-associated lipoprotein [Campylobacter ureolyticus]